MLKINKLTALLALGPGKTRGENIKVSPIMLLKTHVGKMSETSQAIMCMKTKHLGIVRHYMYEK